MRHRPFNLMSLLSAVLLVAVVVLWVIGPWGLDRPGPAGLERGTASPHSKWFLGSTGGGLRMMRQEVTPYNASLRLSADGDRLGFLYLRQDGNVIGTVRHGSLDPSKVVLGIGWEDRTFTKRTMMYAPEAIGGVFVLRYAVVAVPYWLMLLASAVLPVLWLRSMLLRGRRRLLGLCAHCGYDLRATPGRCPECGKVPEPLRRVVEGGTSAERNS